MDYFSAKIRMVVLVEAQGSTSIYDSVFLFKANDWDDAFERALAIGAKEEAEYLNEEEKVVRWRFAEALSLDMIGKLDPKGTEIHCQSSDPQDDSQYPFDFTFNPRNSKPVQTF